MLQGFMEKIQQGEIDTVNIILKADVLGSVEALLEALKKAKPSSAKGIYVRSVTIASTMSPGIKVDPNSLN